MPLRSTTGFNKQKTQTGSSRLLGLFVFNICALYKPVVSRARPLQSSATPRHVSQPRSIGRFKAAAAVHRCKPQRRPCSHQHRYLQTALLLRTATAKQARRHKPQVPLQAALVALVLAQQRLPFIGPCPLVVLSCKSILNNIRICSADVR